MIAAVISIDGGEVDHSVLNRMLEVWRPIPPDAEGTWVGSEIALGEARLRFADDTRSGSLPVHDADHGLVLAWDGRLDNREDLLTALGTRRATTDLTDERLVIDAYARWGAGFAGRLLGDFAFILWDQDKRRVTAGRDHLGLRPLHYASDGHSLVLASRIGQVFEGARIDQCLNERMVADYLANSLSSSDETLFRDVRRVPAAHILQYDHETGRKRVSRYWEPRARAPLRYSSNSEYAEHFRDVLQKAVRSRLRGPHRAGVMLSGGHDSATVACVASELLGGEAGPNRRLATFTAIFDHRPEEDEREYVEALVERGDFEAHYVAADEMWTFKDPEPRAGPWDEPFEGPFDGMIGGLLDRAQQAGVRVVMDGLGGDTLFSGSPYHLFDLFLEGRYRTLSREVKCWPLHEWPQLVGKYVLAPFFVRCPPPNVRGAPEWMQPHLAERLEAQQREQVASSRRRVRRPSQQEIYNDLTWGAFTNKTTLWLQAEALRRGIDLRHPLLDVRMIDFFMAVPSSQMAENRSDKVFIRRAMKDRFPPMIANRRVDLGWYLEPVLKRGLLERWGTVFGGQSHVADLGYVDPALLQRAFLRYVQHESDRDHVRSLALVLRLELWLRCLLGDPG